MEPSKRNNSPAYDPILSIFNFPIEVANEKLVELMTNEEFLSRVLSTKNESSQSKLEDTNNIIQVHECSSNISVEILSITHF